MGRSMGQSLFPMEMTMADANWMDIDVTTLSVEAQIAYSEYKDAQRKAAGLRETFEQSVVARFQFGGGGPKCAA